MTTEKPISVQELKTFIDAVEFASDKEDWIPSERQWKRIRSMIDRLEATPPQQQVRSEPHYAQQMQMPMPAPSAPPVMAAPSAMTQMRMPPQVQQPLTGPFASGGPTPVRTPDVDTSGGNYQSAYA